MNDVLAESLIKLKRIRFRKTWTVSVLLVLRWKFFGCFANPV